MTDLEDAWNRYPTGSAPTAELLDRGRKARRLQIAMPAAGGVIAASVAVTLAVTLNTGGGVPGSTSAAGGKVFENSPLKYVAFRADLKPATSCDQLLSTYRSRALNEVGAWGWTYGGPIAYGGINDQLRGPLTSNGPATMAPEASTGSGQPNSSTGTNVQEVGVDEPDIVKTNGALLVRIDDNTLAIYDVTGASPTRVSTFALPYFSSGQILLSGTTVVAIGNDMAPSGTPNTGSRVETVSLADAAHPNLTSDVAYSGSITSSRQHGSTIRLVMSSGLPTLPFVQPDAHHSTSQATADNRRLVAQSTLAQWLPTIDAGTGPKQMLACENVALAPTTTPLGTTSIVGFDASAPTAVSAIGLSGQTDIAYESMDHLYLTSSGTQLGNCMCPMVAEGQIPRPFGGSDKTAIFQFDLIGDEASHVATGTVSGSIANRWSMDEVGGVLRVATSQWVNGTQTSSVVTMQQSGTSLVEVGRLDGLGKGETLTAARWFPTYAVISTAQQMDPLFTVDLTDPAHPKLLGALHIPGYSSYFHPLGNGLLLGVGQKASFDNTGEQYRSQVGLFDMSNLSNVVRLSVALLPPSTYANAGDDPRDFTWLPDHNVALTSFNSQTGGILVGEFTVTNRRLSEKVFAVPSQDPSTVRTMELPDGRVILMAGATVEFLQL